MLELKGVIKNYLAGENTVFALKGIDLKFRQSELVSILGPSGCGKTTMLNIIGGLDKYTEGDLIINGRSTKKYKDRDWDTYRNHSIGFVFQSYNLIPHQSVLANVELALTLSGVSKSERRQRAKKALEDVGLGNQIHKRPSELSGGQMQRVAIARAIVNNPDIILADEPTGALDTVTSVQVMDILKDIAKDRLVIMVTHNPELAEKYSTRIIKMLDGKITDDSMPLTEEESKKEAERDEKLQAEYSANKKARKKPSMSWGTSFALSLKNLFTKKGRTILTSFAGSIGIIGIALIYSISQGLSTYIDTVQEETLSSYPLTIEATTTDLSSLMETFMKAENDSASHDKDAVYLRSSIYEIMNALNASNSVENDLKTFKSYIESEQATEGSDLSTALNGVQYTYNISPLIFTKNIDGKVVHSDAQKLLTEIVSEYMGVDMSAMQTTMASGGGIMSMMSANSMMSSNIWQEMLSATDGGLISPLITKQYDVVYGEWPSAYNEVVVILDPNNEIDDLSLYALGLESKEEVSAKSTAAMDGTQIKNTGKSKWSYEEICAMDFRLVINADCYQYDAVTDTYTDMRETEAGINYLYDNGIPIKVSGIIRPNEDATSSMLRGTIAYTTELTEYVIKHNSDSAVIKAQLDNDKKDVLTGLPFKDTEGNLSDADKASSFKNAVSIQTNDEKVKTYLTIMSTPSEELLNSMVEQAMTGVTRESMIQAMLQALQSQMGMDEETVASYLDSMSDEDLTTYYTEAVKQQSAAQYAQQAMSELMNLSPEDALKALDILLETADEKTLAYYHDNILEFSNSSYDNNLTTLGYVSLDEPSSINLYAASFEDKDLIEASIKSFNEGKDDLEQIKYTDYVGIMMSSITTIINAITYVLIAFVSISLIVSSIMIGVITLISVQERTKEIGILRAIGASKKNVSSMFNAETMLIGFSSGLLGVLVTYLLCIPINIVIHKLTDLNNLNAYLPIPAAIILVAISVLLTLISGIIPSRSAAKKDPVVALRTE